MTGLKTKRVCAMLDNFGHELDLNANILVELENGCHGVFSSSQVAAARWSRLPSGHPEGLTIAFANIYKALQNALLKTVNGEPCEPDDLDFTDVEYGLEGVKFIEACVASTRDGAVWKDL